MKYFWLLLVFLVACKSSISTDLYDLNGERVAQARYAESSNGVIISVSGKNLSSGIHGFHIHEFGVCEGDFSSAGGHYNPKGKEHGLRNLKGAHAGDLPNVRVRDDGSFRVDVAAAVSMKEIHGKSLVLHADVDDQTSDPEGGSGARIACGTIA